MYGKETQKMVGCCVPWCEEPRCDRKLKKKCALRKYFLLEVKRIRANVQICVDIMGLEWAKAFAEQECFWRKSKN
ncbi:MAG TPA: hypothetical protein PKJ08_00230 [Candidatus Cloacimonadota bacterium]|nr:hypothetical protein [Candidatus Cloacimonadota bacterium]